MKAMVFQYKIERGCYVSKLGRYDGTTFVRLLKYNPKPAWGNIDIGWCMRRKVRPASHSIPFWSGYHRRDGKPIYVIRFHISIINTISEIWSDILLQWHYSRLYLSKILFSGLGWGLAHGVMLSAGLKLAIRLTTEIDRGAIYLQNVKTFSEMKR